MEVENWIEFVYLSERRDRKTGKIKIVVCDNEVISTEKLKRLVGRYCNEKQIPYVADIYQLENEFLVDNIKMIKYQIFF